MACQKICSSYGRVSQSSWNDSLVNSSSSINQIAPAWLLEERTKKKLFTYGLPKKHLEWKHLLKKRWISPPLYQGKRHIISSLSTDSLHNLPIKNEWWNEKKAHFSLYLATRSLHSCQSASGRWHREHLSRAWCVDDSGPFGPPLPLRLKWTCWASFVNGLKLRVKDRLCSIALPRCSSSPQQHKVAFFLCAWGAIMAAVVFLVTDRLLLYNAPLSGTRWLLLSVRSINSFLTANVYLALFACCKKRQTGSWTSASLWVRLRLTALPHIPDS